MAKRVKDGMKVISGQVLQNTYNGPDNKIQLFDGKFTTGYRIKEIYVAPQLPNLIDNTGSEIIVSFNTSPKSTIGQWNFDDVEEIAWAAWNPTLGSRHGYWSLVRPDNMVVQDLFLTTYVADTEQAWIINYMIVLEKYEFTAWDGAATMVRNQSQAGPST